MVIANKYMRDIFLTQFPYLNVVGFIYRLENGLHLLFSGICFYVFEDGDLRLRFHRHPVKMACT